MLSPTDLQAVREGLDARARELEDEIEAKRAADEPGSDAVADQKDQAERSTEALTRDAEVERDRGELLEIAQARQRLAEGSYGICLACGEPIDPRRLLVQPTALRCIACQASAEVRAPGAERL